MVYGIWTFVAALVAFIISAVAGAFFNSNASQTSLWSDYS